MRSWCVRRTSTPRKEYRRTDGCPRPFLGFQKGLVVRRARREPEFQTRRGDCDYVRNTGTVYTYNLLNWELMFCTLLGVATGTIAVYSVVGALHTLYGVPRSKLFECLHVRYFLKKIWTYKLYEFPVVQV